MIKRYIIIYNIYYGETDRQEGFTEKYLRIFLNLQNTGHVMELAEKDYSKTSAHKQGTIQYQIMKPAVYG